MNEVVLKPRVREHANCCSTIRICTCSRKFDTDTYLYTCTVQICIIHGGGKTMRTRCTSTDTVKSDKGERSGGASHS